MSSSVSHLAAKVGIRRYFATNFHEFFELTKGFSTVIAVNGRTGIPRIKAIFLQNKFKEFPPVQPSSSKIVEYCMADDKIDLGNDDKESNKEGDDEIRGENLRDFSGSVAINKLEMELREFQYNLVKNVCKVRNDISDEY